jgi:hypothetical protein
MFIDLPFGITGVGKVGHKDRYTNNPVNAITISDCLLSSCHFFNKLYVFKP